MHKKKSLFMIATMFVITITVGLTGCLSRDKVSTKNVGQPNMYRNYDGIKPLGMNYQFNGNRYPNNFMGNGYRSNYMNGSGYDYGYGYGTHTTNKIKMSQKIADKLVSIKGIKSANVLLTDHNAYVAVVTADSNKYNKPNPIKQNIPYTMHNMYDDYDGQYDNMSMNIKRHIADMVRKEAPTSIHVYVSANPGFVYRMKEYNLHAKQGHPLAGFVQEFEEMVYRLFPTNMTSQPYNNYSPY